jgi:predicted O-methyltransferase YrrM
MRVLEVGTWEGNSACWLLSHVAYREGDTLVCVDTFNGGEEHQNCAVYARELDLIETRCRRNLQIAAQAEGGRGRAEVIKDMSHNVLLALRLRDPPAPFQLIYIDASHYWQDVLQDALLAWPLLDIGGLCIFDDYLWHHVTCPHYREREKERENLRAACRSPAGRGGGGERGGRRREGGCHGLGSHVGERAQEEEVGSRVGGHSHSADEEGGYVSVGVLLMEARGECEDQDISVRERDERCVCPGRAVDLFVQGFKGGLRLVSVGYQVVVEKVCEESVRGPRPRPSVLENSQ